jgi:hypothetical protein
MTVAIPCSDHATPLYLQKMALTSPTSGGRLVGIVCSWAKAIELLFIEFLYDRLIWFLCFHVSFKFCVQYCSVTVIKLLFCGYELNFEV